MLDAHRKGFQAIKAARSSLPVGISLTTQAIEPVGEGSIAAQVERDLYGGWVQAAKDSAGFVGVQTYTRLLIGRAGMLTLAQGRGDDGGRL